MTDPTRPTASDYATIYGQVFLADGTPRRRRIIFTPEKVDDVNRIIDSRSPVHVTPDDAGRFEVLLWPGIWLVDFTDGRRHRIDVLAGDRANIRSIAEPVDP